MSDKKDYSVGLICLNCGCCNAVYVQEGRTTKEQLRIESVVCSHCKIRLKDFKVRAKVIRGNTTSYV